MVNMLLKVKQIVGGEQKLRKLVMLLNVIEVKEEIRAQEDEITSLIQTQVNSVSKEFTAD